MWALRGRQKSHLVRHQELTCEIANFALFIACQTGQTWQLQDNYSAEFHLDIHLSANTVQSKILMPEKIRVASGSHEDFYKIQIEFNSIVEVLKLKVMVKINTLQQLCSSVKKSLSQWKLYVTYS